MSSRVIASELDENHCKEDLAASLVLSKQNLLFAINNVEETDKPIGDNTSN